MGTFAIVSKFADMQILLIACKKNFWRTVLIKMFKQDPGVFMPNLVKIVNLRHSLLEVFKSNMACFRISLPKNTTGIKVDSYKR